MDYETIIYQVEDRIATITFDRPDRLNALSPEMIRELREIKELIKEQNGLLKEVIAVPNGRTKPKK